MAGQPNAKQTNQQEEEAPKLSDKLTAFVNILFAVVVAQSVNKYSDIILHPSWNLPFIALLALYVAVILSWAGYHRALLRYPYRYSIVGLGRLFIDIFIVGVYAFLLFEIQTIKDQGASASLDGYIKGFLIVHILYFLFVMVRWIDYRTDGRVKGGYRQPFLWCSLAPSLRATNY